VTTSADERRRLLRGSYASRMNLGLSHHVPLYDD
jgi:hypothetical protein